MGERMDRKGVALRIWRYEGIVVFVGKERIAIIRMLPRKE